MRLDEAVVSGRGLRPREGQTTYTGCVGVCWPEVPAVASVRTYADTAVEFEIERLRIPPGTNVPLALASNQSKRWAATLPGEMVGRERVPVQEMYERLLERRTPAPGTAPVAQRIGVVHYWTQEPVRYRAAGPLRLAATTTTNPWEIWRSPLFGGYEGAFWPAPPGNEDVQFRQVQGHPPIPTPRQHGGRGAYLRSVGRFDPELLPGFSALSDVPLESYYPPVAFPVDRASREALGGGPLRPTLNLGDYVAQPPFLLTTIEAVRSIVTRSLFRHANQERPISVIRVRVAGATGPDKLSQERIRLVAERIQRETGLTVDVTAGSSPRQVAIELPAGEFGRPALLLREGWVKKGVAVAIVGAVDRKTAALLAA